MSRPLRRARIRNKGRRQMHRDAYRKMGRVIELADAGYSESSIAASVGLKVELVRRILKRAASLDRGEGVR